MSETLRLSVTLPASPERIYTAWLSSGGHSAMTGTVSASEPIVNGQFSSREGYIYGHYLVLEENRRIVMAWRSSQFPLQAPHSRVDVTLQASPEGTLLSLVHSNIPDGQSRIYRRGWNEHYFTPMKDYFTRKKGG